MPPRTLASLAQSLSVATDVEGALKALADSLSSLLVLYEPRKIFGTRTAERFAPAAALFDLAHARFLEQEARQEAVTALEDFTQRLHGEYERKLAALEEKLLAATGEFAAGADPSRVVQLERELAHALEQARRGQKKVDAIEGTVSAAVEQLEK